MYVKTLRPVHEGRKLYPKGSIFETDEGRGERLIELGMVVEASPREVGNVPVAKAEKAVDAAPADKAMAGKKGKTK